MHGTVTSPGWIINPVHATGLSPTQYKIVGILFGVGPNPILFRVWPSKRKKKSKIKNIFWKFVFFSCVFLSILLSIGLYFYTVKIQIWY
jgi:hypothetical protein